MAAGDQPMFARDAEIRRVHREAVVLLGGQRALLMQIAEPRVAQAVAEHSDFPAHAVERLRRTLDAGFGIVFGTRAQARAAAERVNAIHERIHGPGYDALDPSLLAWVHATLADTAMLCFRLFVGPLDRRRYWQDSRSVAALFRVPGDALPASIEEFDAYVSRTAGALAVSETARRLARHVLRPPIRWVPQPALAPLRTITAALLPPPLRRQFGLRLWAPERAAFAAACRTARAGIRVLPPAVRFVRPARD